MIAKRLSRCLRAGIGGALLLVALAGLTACGSDDGGSETFPTSPLPTGALANDAEVLQGRTLYATFCAECHGFTGLGGAGSSFTDGKLFPDFADVDAQVAFVRQGRGAMPAFGARLNDAEIHAIVRYEREVLSTPQ